MRRTAKSVGPPPYRQKTGWFFKDYLLESLVSLEKIDGVNNLFVGLITQF